MAATWEAGRRGPHHVVREQGVIARAIALCVQSELCRVGIVYVFGTRSDTVQIAESVHDKVQAIAVKAGLRGSWTPRELRHTFTSIMSEAGASIELIADLLGHKDTATTWKVYRHQLRPVITKGAELIDEAIRNKRQDLKGHTGASMAP